MKSYRIELFGFAHIELHKKSMIGIQRFIEFNIQFSLGKQVVLEQQSPYANDPRTAGKGE